MTNPAEEIKELLASFTFPSIHLYDLNDKQNIVVDVSASYQTDQQNIRLSASLDRVHVSSHLSLEEFNDTLEASLHDSKNSPFESEITKTDAYETMNRQLLDHLPVVEKLYVASLSPLHPSPYRGIGFFTDDSEDVHHASADLFNVFRDGEETKAHISFISGNITTRPSRFLFYDFHNYLLYHFSIDDPIDFHQGPIPSDEGDLPDYLMNPYYYARFVPVRLEEVTTLSLQGDMHASSIEEQFNATPFYNVQGYVEDGISLPTASDIHHLIDERNTFLQSTKQKARKNKITNEFADIDLS